MRPRHLLISGSLAVLGLVIAGGVLLRLATHPAAAAPDTVLWTLTSLQVNGQTHPLVPHVSITLTFHASIHTITGSSGCNSYQATYQLQNAQVRLHDFAVTSVGCLGPDGAQENLYLQALSQAKTLLVSGKVMTIMGAEGKDLLRFSSS